MKVYIGRHHYAGDFSLDPKKERERPLTPEGVAAAKAIAQRLIDDDEVPSTIFCSPFTRTTQTADIYGKAFSAATGDQCQVNVVGGFSPVRPLETEFANLIQGDDLKKIMVIGHVDNTTPAFRNFGKDANTGDKWQDLVMGEVRRLKVDRGSLEWEIRYAVKPSDLGFLDHKS